MISLTFKQRSAVCSSSHMSLIPTNHPQKNNKNIRSIAQSRRPGQRLSPSTVWWDLKATRLDHRLLGKHDFTPLFFGSARAPNSRRPVFGSPARFHQRCHHRHGGCGCGWCRCGVLWRRWCREVVASRGMAVHRWWTGWNEDLAGTRAKWDLDLKNFDSVGWEYMDNEWQEYGEIVFIFWEKYKKIDSVDWVCSAWCCVKIYCLISIGMQVFW